MADSYSFDKESKAAKARGVTAANELVKLGWSPAQAAGIVGNLYHESGVNPNSVQKGGPGRGIAQWSVGERWATFQSWAASRGLVTSSLDAQVQFLNYELTVGSEKSAGAALKKTTSVTQAAQVFMTKDERPQDQSAGAQNNRAQTASEFWNYWAGGDQKIAILNRATNDAAAANADANSTQQKLLTSGAANTVGDAIDAANPANAFGDVASIVKHFGDPSFWLRIGFVVIGLGLVFIAAAHLTGGSIVPTETPTSVRRVPAVPVE